MWIAGNLCDGWWSGWLEGADTDTMTPGCVSEARGPGSHSERGLLDSKGNQRQRSRRASRPCLFQHLMERILPGRSLNVQNLTTSLEEKRPRLMEGTLLALETEWDVTRSWWDCPRPPFPPNPDSLCHSFSDSMCFCGQHEGDRSRFGSWSHFVSVTTDYNLNFSFCFDLLFFFFSSLQQSSLSLSLS